MAVVINGLIGSKRCWACGRGIPSDEPAVTLRGDREIVYMHQGCAKSKGHQIIRDISELIDLGYGDDDDKLN